jgi:hypothetical protein
MNSSNDQTILATFVGVLSLALVPAAAAIFGVAGWGCWAGE